MERTIGNFTKQGTLDFPLDCETLEMLQDNASLLALLGNIAGDKVVLCGCEKIDAIDGEERNEGYVYMKTQAYPNGEILRWEGGPTINGMHIYTEDVRVQAMGNDYPSAYTKRRLAPGIGSENYAWEDFTDLKNVKELMTEINALQAKVIELEPKPALLGIIEMWAGKKVPEGYALCDGRELDAKEYGALYEAIGTTFNSSADYNGNSVTTTEGYFRLPDLRGRFIVGENERDTDYSKKGNVGGSKKHTLTGNEIPSHSHAIKTGLLNVDGGDYVETLQPSFRTNVGGTYVLTDTAGGGNAHENRPPYYVLAYIMRVKQ